MSKKDLVLGYFKKDFEDDDTIYYLIKKGYACLFNEEITISVIQIDKASGDTEVGGDQTEACEFHDHDWKLVSVHQLKTVLGATP